MYITVQCTAYSVYTYHFYWLFYASFVRFKQNYFQTIGINFFKVLNIQVHLGWNF